MSYGDKMEFKHMIHPITGEQCGYLDTEATGAIPNGSLIAKCDSKNSDAHKDGAIGTVLGSVAVPQMVNDEFALEGRPPEEFFYFVEWNANPGVPCGIISSRVKPYSLNS